MTVKKAKRARLLGQAMDLVWAFDVWADGVNNAHAAHLCANCRERMDALGQRAQALRQQFKDESAARRAPSAPRVSPRGKKEKLGGKGERR